MEKNDIKGERVGDIVRLGNEDSIINDGIFIAGAFGALSGILFFSSVSIVSLLISFVVLCVLIVLRINHKNKSILFLIVFTSFLFLGAIRVWIEPTEPTLPTGAVTFSGVVDGYPEVRDAGVRYNVLVSTISDSNFQKPVSILVDAVRFPEAFYGDRIVVKGTIKVPGIIKSDDGRDFDYGTYLRGAGYAGVVSFAQIQSIEKGSNNFHRFLYSIRSFLSIGIDRALPEPGAGLLKGILLGEKHSMGKEAETWFRGAGLSHIVVLSGYNVMIVISAGLFLMRGLSIRFAPYVAGTALIGFVIATGADETSIRAGLMAGIMLLGLVLRRKYKAGRALSIAVILFAVFDPFKAVSISFLLSVAATFAIIYAAPKIKEKLYRIPEKMSLREIVSTTVSAQLFVAPIIFYSMGQMPVFSIIANILVLPFMPLTMAMGFVSSVFGVINFLPAFFGFPSYFLLEYVLRIAHSFSKIPFSIHLPPFSGLISWLVYVFLISFFMSDLTKETKGVVSK